MEALVTVELKNGAICKVASEALEVLLEHNEIAKLKRSAGWAIIGRDPFRVKGKGFVYSIPDRRDSYRL